MTERLLRFLRLLVLLSLCILPVIAQSSDDYWPPWVTQTTTNSATINWRGEANGTGSIDYARAVYFDKNNRYEKTISTLKEATYQHVLISGLEPNTSYTYRVRPSGTDRSFDNRTFRTMPESGPFSFIVISDPQKGQNYDETKRFKYVADAIEKEPDILFILIGGDYNGHDSDLLWRQFFDVADGMLSKSAIFPAIGNHEYHGDNMPAAAYHYHWAFDNSLNYSFDCSKVRFIILNSPDPNNFNSDEHPSLALSESQEPWLKEQLDNNTMLGVFTLHHHPIWDHNSTTPERDLKPWEDLYHAYNISATFAGHVHNYQRYLIEGIPYFVVGNAGGSCSDLTGNSPPAGYKFGMNKTLGYLKVTVDPANNTATAQEWIVATVKYDDSADMPDVFKAPKMIDSVTFPLRHQSQ